MQIDLNQPGALTLVSVSQLIGSANDSTHTQLRVTDAGIAYISNTDVGLNNVDNLAFRFETWSRGTDYVGKRAASDPAWVERIYNALKANWPTPSSSYLDIY
ncbi:hypothetical protein [Pseudomonas syringae]|uniref:hypothetical protein n=1 Tax=Pseudomonas syringae TaxID=317 RepID=UPI00200A1FE2|nr:hypothetical protein [Pseudomonas syringae]MCK9691322.1 hypothetical protein [Pseudomonas syringae pv. syringae]